MAKTRSYLTVPGLTRAIASIPKYNTRWIRVNGHKFTVSYDPEVYYGDAATPFLYRMGIRLNPYGAVIFSSMVLGENPLEVAGEIFRICV